MRAAHPDARSQYPRPGLGLVRAAVCPKSAFFKIRETLSRALNLLIFFIDALPDLTPDRAEEIIADFAEVRSRRSPTPRFWHLFDKNNENGSRHVWRGEPAPATRAGEEVSCRHPRAPCRCAAPPALALKVSRRVPTVPLGQNYPFNRYFHRTSYMLNSQDKLRYICLPNGQ